MTDTLKVLREARELLSNEARWIKYASALDEDSTEVEPVESAAVRWCLTGAIDRFQIGAGFDVHSEALRLAALSAGCNALELVDFNDARTTTHADVLRVLDAAIARAEGEA